MCDVAVWVEGGEGCFLALCIFQVEVKEDVDKFTGWGAKRRARYLASGEYLEDFGYAGCKVRTEVFVEMDDVEDELEGFRERHELHGLRVFLRWLARGFGVAGRMACYCCVDAVCELVLAYELCVVEICIVGHEEEDAGGEEFIVDVVTLWQLVRYTAFGRMLCSCLELICCMRAMA